ncbi:MAG: hypothetical protein ACWGOX_10175 [Desulforhopalus sp.]
MRCPKCGYISFDHLAVCLKCNKSIDTGSSSLNGHVMNIKVPSFLELYLQKSVEPAAERELGEDEILLDEEFVDEDLDILVEDEGPGVAAESGLEDKELGDFELPEGSINFDSDEPADDESREIEIDLSQFDNAVETEKSVENETVSSGGDSEEPSIDIDFPEELADISDLAPPAKEPRQTAQGLEGSSDEDFPDLDLGDLDFDLELEDLETSSASGPAGEGEPALSLDDIEFPETLDPGSAKKKQSNPGQENDDDLNIELDLGGLSIHKDV